MPKNKNGFSAMQQRFIELFNGNATEAARAAGYSPKNAGKIGGQLLSNPRIASAIFNREKTRRAADIADREERQKFWTAVFRDEHRPMKDRLRASELLAKSEGDFIDRTEISGKDGAPLTVRALLQEISTADVRIVETRAEEITKELQSENKGAVPHA